VPLLVSAQLHPAQLHPAQLHPALAPLRDRLPLPDAGVLTAGELAALTSGLAAVAPLLDVVRYDPARRWWVRLALTDAVEVWLLGWSAGQATEPHDHGGAQGSCTVLAGTLREQLYDATTARPLGRRVHTTGVTVPFAADHAHAMTARTQAASVHAYSPPLLPTRRLVVPPHLPAIPPPVHGSAGGGVGRAGG